MQVSPASLSAVFAVLALVPSTLAAQSEGPVLGPAAGKIITAEDIELSKARTAWEALRRTAPFLRMREDGASGAPDRILWRGKGSMHKIAQPRIVVDGILLPSVTYLWSIPAEQIERIQILNGIDGTTFYGSDTVGGVIYIYTKRGRPQG